MAQQRHLDSLLKLSASVTDQVERCRLYLEISRLYQQSDTSKASLYVQKAKSLAAQLQDDGQYLHINLVLAKHYLNLRAFDKARSYTDKALSLAEQSKDQKALATIWYYSGCIHLSENNTKKALDDFIRSYRLAAVTGDHDLEAHVSSSFGVVYQQQNQLDSALTYYKKSFAYFENSSSNNSEYAMVGSQNIGNILLAQGLYTEGQDYLQRALKLAKQRRDLNAEMIILGNISNGYEREGKRDLAALYATELIRDAEKAGFMLQVMYGKSLLATIRLDEKKYDEAILRAKEALVLAEEAKIPSFIQSLYDMLIAGYEGKGDYRQAYYYKNQSVRFKDSLSVIENSSYIEEIKQKYNLQKKNQELLLKTELIEQIKKAGQQKTVIIISLLVLGLSGVVSVFLFFQRRKIREELARKNLSLENQGKNFEAFIKGQEEERKRIASDLHDGLAQHLVMLKMGIQSIGTGNDQQQEKLNYYSGEIDTMIEETRRISHNMMPGVLVDLGLLKALKSLVADINTHHPELQVNLSSNEGFTTLAADTEIQLYRIIQELLNNIIKHSGATTCSIQLHSTPGLVSITVNDNGKGFETGTEKSGIGLRNIRSRVDSLNGILKIDTAPQQGTSVHIQLHTH